MDFQFTVQKIKENVSLKFANKGGNLVDKNIKAIDACVDGMTLVKLPVVDYVMEVEPKKNIFEIISSMEGDSLPVSSFLKNPDGTFEAGTTKSEKRNTFPDASVVASVSELGEIVTVSNGAEVTTKKRAGEQKKE